MKKKLFGTDGIRGPANTYPLTRESAAKAGKAFACFFKKNSNKKKIRAVIGMDPRLSSEMLSNAVISGIQSGGCDTLFLGIAPTPFVSLYVKEYGFDFGVVISASHNPFHDNGIKLFNNRGTKLNDDEEIEIESIYFNDPEGDRDIGKAINTGDIKEKYLSFIRGKFEPVLNKSKFNLSVDCANGAMSPYAADIFSSFKGISAVVYSNVPDGRNINENCGALYPQKLSEKVLENRSDAGIAYDGDGDRLIMTDETGHVVDGDKLIGLTAVYLKSKGLLKNDTAVTTVMSNAGLENYLRKNGISMIRAGVGDRYVFEKMQETGAVLGGENSGHIIYTGISPTGDGLAASLLILQIMTETGKKLSELVEEIELYPQILEKLKVKEKIPLEKIEGVSDIIEKEESRLKGGRVLIRYSGTEPVMRIMAEGPDSVQVRRSVDNILDFLRKKV
jgi:phosphoglucosamine mutase